MYSKVDSAAALKTFNQIWMECWLEKGYKLERSTDKADRFLIKDRKQKNVGTVEFKPYSPLSSNEINTVYPFHKIKQLANKADFTAEIDKAAILKEHRGKNLARMLSLIVHYAERYQIEYCVALLDQPFYKTLKLIYNIPVIQVGERVYYKGAYVLPSLIYPQKVVRRKKKYPWLLPEQA